jgi:hypothetical protein
MAVFWIHSTIVSRTNSNIAYAFDVAKCESVDDFRACIIKDGAVCGIRLELSRTPEERTRLVVGRKPTMVTLSGIAQAALLDWTLIEPTE